MGLRSRPFVNPGFTQLKAMPLGFFLAVEDKASDASDFYDRTEMASAKDSPLRVPIKSCGKGRDC
jgi:hypothetical protein